MTETNDETQGIALSQVGPKQTKPVPGANNGKSRRPPPVASTPLYRVKKPVFIYGRQYRVGDVIPFAGKVGKSGCLEPIAPPAEPAAPAQEGKAPAQEPKAAAETKGGDKATK